MLRQGRYKSLIIEDDFGLLKVVDYIHLNPVSASIVAVSQLKEYSNGSFPQYFTRYRHPNLRCEDFLAEAGGLKPTAEHPDRTRFSEGQCGCQIPLGKHPDREALKVLSEAVG